MNKFSRSVAATVLCASLLLGGTSCASKNTQLNNTLTDFVSHESTIKFNGVYYYACYKECNGYHVSIVAKKDISFKDDDYEKENPFYTLDYVVDEEDYIELKNCAETFEDLYPFENDVIIKLLHIVQNYNPVSTKRALLTDDGKEMLNELIK